MEADILHHHNLRLELEGLITSNAQMKLEVEWLRETIGAKERQVL